MSSYLEFLKDPRAYPHRAGEVILLQTHISYVFLAGSYVYKVKKPVDFGFLDFTTLARRRYYCEEELRLNRRLCPDIYLDVVPIRQKDDHFELGGSGGRIVEYAVKMVRMPAEGMMDKVIEAGNLTRHSLGKIVDILVPFYQQAETGPEIVEAGSRDSVAGNIRDNFQQTEPFIGCPVLCREDFDRLRGYAEGVLADDQLFRRRQEEGWIRDGHGDLHSSNICLGERVWIFDCIEFNRGLRYGDLAADLAFLAMDLDYRGQEQDSIWFVDTISQRLNDPGLHAVLNFYKCYRAYVRGKIGLLTGQDREVDESTRAASLQRAGRYFKLAVRYAEQS
ncbi:MAG: hypothetical protein R6W72_05490 [Desulfurivibrionaceae bacterium]